MTARQGVTRLLRLSIAVFVIALVLALLIGQHGDGPLGSLPEWLGAASYATWAIALLVAAAAGSYLTLSMTRQRRHGDEVR